MCNSDNCDFWKQNLNPTNLEQHLARVHSNDNSGIWQDYWNAKDEQKKRRFSKTPQPPSTSAGVSNVIFVLLKN